MGISSLSAALSGVQINQAQIDVISNNIANVGTEGFSRRILPQSTQAIGGVSIGVVGETIVRNVDLTLERDLFTQISATSFYDVQSTFLGRVDQFHGAPDAGVSIAAEIGRLQDSFSALANSPTDQFLTSEVIDQARDTTERINDLADLYTTLRNDAQAEAAVTVQAINDLLVQIAELNSQIRFSTISGNTTAEIEDSRSQAINELSELIEISSFPRGDGALVVQTLEGIELASETAQQLTFRPVPLSPSSFFPDSASGIFVGDPQEGRGAFDITDRNIGGQLGALITLRDETFPQQTAQLDELAHKLALRFEAQGLRLFTDQSGIVPADIPPDLTTDPPTTVPYVGFSSLIQINSRVLDDPSLVQAGTSGEILQSGANDVIRRVIEFAFGSVDFQQAANTDPATSVDIRAAATGGTTLQDYLGLRSNNTLSTGLALTNFPSVADIISAGGVDTFGTGATQTDTFILRFDDPDFGAGPYDIEIDLSAVAPSGVNAAQDLVNHITADPDFAGAVADFGASVSVGLNGQLEISSSSNIEIAPSSTQPISEQGLAFLGFEFATAIAEDPYFEVQVGNNDPVRITINPATTEVELLADLNAVNGLVAQIDADGFLQIRPGNSFTDPDFGGDINIIGGPFTTSGASLTGTAAGRTSIDDGVNIAQALFGTYTVTGTGIVEGFSPVTNVEYQSETQAGSGVFVPFRQEFLGPSASINTEIVGAQTLEDLSQRIISNVSQELSLANQRGEDEESLRSLIQQQLLNESGVNIDVELGNLIVVQNAFAASARVITVVDEIFQELLNIV